jgi:2-dehydro-3-deoxygluconokinase
MKISIAAFGELMLRLSPPGRERLLQSPRLETNFGGGEANVAVSLARFGHSARLISILPDHPLGDAAVGELGRRGVGTSFIVRTGGRLGLYFSEPGSGPRPSEVLYDRDSSAFASAAPGTIDWDQALAGVDWFHTSGITPALSRSAADLTRQALRACRSKGLKVSIDLNYRSKLWRYGVSAPEVMRDLFAHADLGVANEEDCRLALGFESAVFGPDGAVDAAAVEDLLGRVKAAFPRLEWMAVTLRESRSADHNIWSAALLGRSGFRMGPRREIFPIVDRIGAGDAFSAGLIHGLHAFGSEEEALAFAVAASALKHTIPGDFNLATESEVLAVMSGDVSGRIRR